MPNKATGEVSYKTTALTKDEGIRAHTTLLGLQSLSPALGPDKSVTAGNASELFDGASACLIMEESLAAKKVLVPSGATLASPWPAHTPR